VIRIKRRRTSLEGASTAVDNVAQSETAGLLPVVLGCAGERETHVLITCPLNDRSIYNQMAEKKKKRNSKTRIVPMHEVE
jgi:hypothetical protein